MTETIPMPPADTTKEQYMKGWDLFNSEVSRFWVRFNILIGAQFVVAASIGANAQYLNEYWHIAGVLFFALFAVSVFTVLIVGCCWRIADGILDSIREFESRNSSLVMLKTFERHSAYSHGMIVGRCHLLSRLLLVVWFVLIVATISPSLVVDGQIDYIISGVVVVTAVGVGVLVKQLGPKSESGRARGAG